ncbi:MAG: site-specific integrase [Butyrivibrio sp.]|nr:site-specific integrase [Butyrivibrio sp.]
MPKKQFSDLFFSKTKDFLDVFLPKQNNRSSETVRAYRISLNSFYDYVTETAGIPAISFRFSDCTYDFFLGYPQFLREQKNLAPSTVNQRFAALKTYLKYVADADFSMIQVYLAAKKVPLLRTEKLQRPIIEKDGLSAFLAAPPDTRIGNRDRMLLVMLFDTAVRISELLGIRLGDISLTASNPTILIYGKGKKQRIVSLNEKTALHLREYVASFHGKDPSPDAYLFYTTIHGKRMQMSVRNAERIVKKYAGIAKESVPDMPENCYPHMLRRSRASGLYRDGVPIEMIAAILGHSSSETTKIYAIPSVEQMKEALKIDQDETDGTKHLWEGREEQIRKMFGL